MMNMKGTLICVILAFTINLHGQYLTDLRISPAKGEQACYNVELYYQSEKSSKLASQNYRIFYDARLAKFNQEESHLLLPDEDYLFTVVQTNHDIDASGVGPLTFEGHLGFINATVLLNDIRLDGLSLDQKQGWTPTVQLCFESTEEGKTPHIVLARRDLTSSYGRAFVELSVVDQFDAIQALTIDQYYDLEK